MLPVADMVEAALGAPPCLLRQPSARRRLIARFALIGLTCTVAVFGASQFDHFISLVGVLCAMPLGFLCPAASRKRRPPCPTTPPHQPTSRLQGLTPPLRTPERRRSSSGARRGLSSSPQAAPTLSLLSFQPPGPALIYLRLCDDLGVASAFGRATARLTLLVAPLFMLGGLVSVVLSWNESR